MNPTYIVMNHITLVVNWSPITFGRIKLQLYIDIYNMRVSYPLKIIILAMANKGMLLLCQNTCQLIRSLRLPGRRIFQFGYHKGFRVYLQLQRR